MKKKEMGNCPPLGMEEINLCNELYPTDCLEELKGINRHEIVVKICDIIGSCPEKLCIAEKILDSVKYDIAKYILHHEYCPETRNKVRPKFLLWLDEKIEPEKAEELTSFAEKYLK